jgi:cell division protein FtsI/penicillin-binding protein 2
MRNVSPNKLNSIDAMGLVGVEIFEYPVKKYEDNYIGPVRKSGKYSQRGNVYANPMTVVDVERVAPVLSAALNLEEAFVRRSFEKKKVRYVPIARKILPRQSLQIKELDMDGVVLTAEHWRYYPEESLASNLLGFVNMDGDGQYGLEGQFEEDLHGKDGIAFVDRDIQGRQIAAGSKYLVAAENGEDFTLTLDRLIQRHSETVLKKYVNEYEAESGQVIVMEPFSGKVLAMASYPDYNPNEYYKAFERDEKTGELLNKIGAQAFDNPAVSIPYEPGSVMKAMTMASALDAGVVKPQEIFEDDGDVVVGPYTIKNFDKRAYGNVTMTQILENSLNTGMVYIAMKMGPRMFHNYINSFGFGSKLGIGLEVENSGLIPPINKWSKAAFLTSSFGQGFTATPLQVTSAISAIANGGLLMQPLLIENRYEPKIIRRVVSEDAAAKTRAMMASVVENGHAKKAQVKGYYVAGKTGTSQVPNEDGPGYSETKYIASFAGFAPIEDPKFVILVKVNYPKDVIFGSAVAAPAFSEIAEFLFRYFEIQPSK